MARRLLAPLTVIAGFALGFTIACAPEDPDEAFRGDYTPGPEYWIPAPLPNAYCSIVVEGIGNVDMETDYLPHVITCENGGANLEALKAQAIAARSVAYYAMANDGSICDSQGCQVYSCGAEPSAKAYQAVEETSGLYLNYNNVLTYAFYVAGDNNTSPPACVGSPGAPTEGWITYNEGKSGTSVEQTALGWVFNVGDAGYGQNRGCMGQWGARCLENNNGYNYEQILQFYYGADINITQAQGACIMELGGGDTTTTTDSGDGDTTTTTTTTTGDGDTTTTTTSGGDTWGDSGSGDDGTCTVGSLGCVCTMGGGCDPGLICANGYCVPEGPSETGGNGTSDGGGTGNDSVGDDVGSEGPGFQDDAFDQGDGCNCSTEDEPKGTGLAGLALLGLFGLARRRRR